MTSLDALPTEARSGGGRPHHHVKASEPIREQVESAESVVVLWGA